MLFRSIFCPALLDVPVTPALFEYVATNNKYRFGKLSVIILESGKAVVEVGYALLGTYLDPEELTVAVGMVAGLADDLDDEMKAKFGGRRFHED